MYSCYFIKSLTNPNLSYNGSTNNLCRRLRQHNGEIKGGAFRTTYYRPWEYYAIVSNIPDRISALQMEWRLRYPSNKKKKEKRFKGIEGRIVGLNEVIKLEHCTSNAKISIKDMTLHLYILKEYEHLLTDIPEYITVHIVEKIDIKNI